MEKNDGVRTQNRTMWEDAAGIHRFNPRACGGRYCYRDTEQWEGASPKGITKERKASSLQ